MKVLWLRPSKGDNISVRRERIAEHLRQLGYEIDIVDATGLDALGAIKAALFGGYDVIAGNVRAGLYLGYPLSRLLRTPLLGDVSDPISDIDYLPGPLFRFFRWYEWFILQRVGATVFVYKDDHDAANYRGIANACYLPNAVDFDTFSDPDPSVIASAETLLNAQNIDTNRPMAIYIGGMADHYEIEAITDAATSASDWEFVFVGEGPLDELVRHRAASTSNVYHLGTVEHEVVPGLLANADVGFCFKDAEQPLKLKEYGAAGLPIIVQPGELERFHAEDELVFVDPKPSAIAAALERLASDDSLYEARSTAARELARGWTWEDVAEEYDRLFRDLAG